MTVDMSEQATSQFTVFTMQENPTKNSKDYTSLENTHETHANCDVF